MSTIGTIGSLASTQVGLRARIDTLTRQVSNGQVSHRHGDLGPDARRAIDLRAEIGRREAYGHAADRALGRADAMQTVMSRLQVLPVTSTPTDAAMLREAVRHVDARDLRLDVRTVVVEIER